MTAATFLTDSQRSVDSSSVSCLSRGTERFGTTSTCPGTMGLKRSPTSSDRGFFFCWPFTYNESQAAMMAGRGTALSRERQMPRSGRRVARVVALCRMPRAPMRAAAVLLCLAVALLPPAVVRGDACEEEMLLQTVYKNIMSLPYVHPARVVLKNLVVGHCNLQQYQREKKEVLDMIAETQATIFLLGGENMISMAEEVNAGDVGVCTAEAENAGCEEAQAADIFSSLADDPSASVKTYNGDPQLPAVLNSRCLSLSVPWPRIMPRKTIVLTHACTHSLMRLASDYCDAHTIYRTVPATRKLLSEVQAEEAELIALGCPCDISAVYPLGGEEGGGFNISVTVAGLDTRRPKATGMSCIINGVVKVPARAVSVDTVQCEAPSAIAANISGNSTRAGEVQLASVQVVGAKFKLSRSTKRVNFLRYYKAPVFDLARLTPGAFIAGPTPFSQRMITVAGADFNENAGGMYLRLRHANVSSGPSELGQIELQLLDATRAIGVLPPSPDPGAFRFEISLNSDTWYNPGTLEYVQPPVVELLDPSTGPVKGNTPVVITHSRVPSLIGELEAKLGQLYVRLHRVSDTQMQLVTPAHTLQGDPGWYTPGNETLEIYLIVSVDPYTSFKERFLFSLETNGTGARFSYQCSADEVEDKTCCPAGTAGQGGSNGSFCFPCASGKFGPDVGATACLTCPANAVSGNASTNCTCVAGFGYQAIINPAQTCSACAAGTFRNSTMTACETCPTGTEVSPARTSCKGFFAGCSAPDTYQPRNGTQVCCPFGQVLPIPAVTCIPCPAGTYFNTTSLLCVDCEAGSFSASPGLLSCGTCAHGTFAGAVSSVWCVGGGHLSIHMCVHTYVRAQTSDVCAQRGGRGECGEGGCS